LAGVCILGTLARLSISAAATPLGGLSSAPGPHNLSTITIKVNIPSTAMPQFVPNRGLKMWEWLKRLFTGGGGNGNTGSGG
jgi:hypothetical protein